MIDRARASTAMDAAGLDALVASSLENVFYATGVRPAIDELGVLAFAVVPRDVGRRVALVAPAGQLAVVAQAGVEDVDLVPYGRFVVDVAGAPAEHPDVARYHALLDAHRPRATARDALREALGGARSIGLDELRVPAPVFAEIGPAAPAAEVFARLRMVKSPAEIERLRGAAEILEAAQAASIAAIEPGIGERELLARFEAACRVRGAMPAGGHIAAGPRSVLPLSTTYPRAVEAGDVVKYDVICAWRHYHADTGRTVVVGPPSRDALAAFDAVRLGTLAAVQAIRPGAVAGDVFRASVDAVRAAGFPDFDRHQVGHGIGLDIHEPPFLAEGGETVLEPGMVVCAEAPLYSTSVGGWQLEDTVVVTDDGCEYLTTTARNAPLVA